MASTRLSYAGLVRAEDGRVLAGVRIVLLLPRELRGRIGAVLDASAECGWIARTDEQGRFEMNAFPGRRGHAIPAQVEGILAGAKTRSDLEGILASLDEGTDPQESLSSGGLDPPIHRRAPSPSPAHDGNGKHRESDRS